MTTATKTTKNAKATIGTPEKLGDDYLDEAKDRWNRSRPRDPREIHVQCSDAEWDAKNPRRIVISNINGELGAYIVTASGRLRRERGEEV